MPLLVAALGLILMFLMITNQWKTRRKFVTVLVPAVLVLTITFLVFQPLRLNVAKTIARTTYQDVMVSDQVIEAERPDLIRWTIYYDALSLYETNWLFGIGYMNFMPWFGDMYNFESETAGGKEIIGMNLHSTFQTLALEGGLPCVGIVTFLLWKYFSILRRRIKQSKIYLEKLYYKMFIIGMICLLVEGMFHQIHQTPMLFMFLGIVYALDDKDKYFNVGTLRYINR